MMMKLETSWPAIVRMTALSSYSDLSHFWKSEEGSDACEGKKKEAKKMDMPVFAVSRR